MHARLALALFVSTLLVGGALWIRLSNGAEIKYELATVESDDAADAELLQYFLEPPEETPTAPVKTAPLTNTDILGRQLVMDYINLAASGEATEAQIETLAQKYVEIIPALNLAESISYIDLTTAPNTKANFQKYADEITAIHKTYAENISKKYVGVNLDKPNAATYSFALAFGQAYRDAAEKLKDISVPNSLVQVHLKLTNSYLSSAASMKAVAQIDLDSASAFAGVITLNQNLNQEDALRGEISKILTANGL